MSAAGPSQGAKHAPSGSGAAAVLANELANELPNEAASVGVHICGIRLRQGMR